MSVQFVKFIEDNLYENRFQYNSCVGSINLADSVIIALYGFQYNSCVGSIELEVITNVIFISNFNTTLVSVQYSLNELSTSTRGNFNTTLVSVQSSATNNAIVKFKFQYNSCVGSMLEK